MTITKSNDAKEPAHVNLGVQEWVALVTLAGGVMWACVWSTWTASSLASRLVRLEADYAETAALATENEKRVIRREADRFDAQQADALRGDLTDAIHLFGESMRDDKRFREEITRSTTQIQGELRLIRSDVDRHWRRVAAERGVQLDK